MGNNVRFVYDSLGYRITHLVFARRAKARAPMPSTWIGSAGFQAGIGYVPQPMLGVIHEGEAVLTAAENRRRREGGGGSTLVVERGGIVVQGVSDPEAAAALAVRKLEIWLSHGQGRERIKRYAKGRS